MKHPLQKKRLIVFDLDGTLSPSKSFTDKEMVGLLLRLLEERRVAVIGGGRYSQFQQQILSQLPHRDARLQNLFLFPTTASAFYRYHNGWKNVYTKTLSPKIKSSIRQAFREVLKEVDYQPPKKIYGL